MRKRRIRGYVVLAHREYPNSLHYVGLLEREGGKTSLFNGVDEATLFSTKRAANSAMRSAHRYQQTETHFPEYNIDRWQVITLYTR